MKAGSARRPRLAADSLAAVSTRPVAVGATDPLLSLRLRPLLSAVRAQPVTFWLLCVYITFEYLRPQAMYPILDVAPWGLLSIVACAGSVLFMGDRRLRLGRIDKLFILFSCLVVLSGIFAFDPAYSWSQRNTYLSWILLYFCVTSIITTPRRAFLFWIFFFLINFKMSQHGARSFATRGFSFAGWGIAGAPGWFQNSGELALEMLVLFAMSWTLLVTLRPYLSKLRWRLIVVAIPGTAFLSVIASSSRGGQLALVVVLISLAVMSGVKLRTLSALVVVAVVGYTLLPAQQKERFASMGEDETSQQRLTLWREAVVVIDQNRMTGIGYRNWLPFYSARAGPDAPLLVIHNTFLEAMVDLGVPGGIVFVALLGTALKTNRNTRRAMKGRNGIYRCVGGMAHGLNLGLIGSMIAGFFMSILFYPIFWMAFALTSALEKTARQDQLPGLKTSGRPFSRRAARTETSWSVP